jgi:hypothetical protein
MMLGYFEGGHVTVLVSVEINDGKVMVAGAGAGGISNGNGNGNGNGNESIDILPRPGLVIRSRRHHVSKLPQTAIGHKLPVKLNS